MPDAPGTPAFESARGRGDCKNRANSLRRPIKRIQLRQAERVSGDGGHFDSSLSRPLLTVANIMLDVRNDRYIRTMCRSERGDCAKWNLPIGQRGACVGAHRTPDEPRPEPGCGNETT